MAKISQSLMKFSLKMGINTPRLCRSTQRSSFTIGQIWNRPKTISQPYQKKKITVSPETSGSWTEHHQDFARNRAATTLPKSVMIHDYEDFKQTHQTFESVYHSETENLNEDDIEFTDLQNMLEPQTKVNLLELPNISEISEISESFTENLTIVPAHTQQHIEAWVEDNTESFNTLT